MAEWNAPPFGEEVGPSEDRPYPQAGAGMSGLGIPCSFSPAISTGSQRLPSENLGIRIHIAQPRGTLHFWSTGEMVSTCSTAAPISPEVYDEARHFSPLRLLGHSLKQGLSHPWSGGSSVGMVWTSCYG